MSEVESLAAALIDANDQLLALYELATLSTNTLDRESCVAPILERAGRILGTSSLRFEEADAFTDREIAETNQHEQATTVTTADGRSGTVIATREEPFGTADTKLLRAVGHIVLGAVQTAELHEEALDQALVAKEHDAAAELAQMVLPTRQPLVDGLDVFARSDPARLAGGDLYAFVQDGQVLSFVVGDVSGKGLPAAMVMTMMVTSATAALGSHGDDPVAALHAIDSSVYDYLNKSGLFCTLLAGTVDASTGEFSIANAGHSPVFVTRTTPGGDATIESIPATAPPIGVLPLDTTTLRAFSSTLEPDEWLVACSDGFTEQTGSDEDMFGEQRLVEAVTRSGTGADELGQLLFSLIDEFADGASQSDDRTLLLIERSNSASGVGETAA